MTVGLWSFVLYTGLVLVIPAAMVGLSALLGERHRERYAAMPYESGILSEGTARVRLSVKFYPLAMFFVVFDLESVFLYTWAVAARILGWAGYAEALLFIVILVVALVYLWRLGALDWAPGTRRRVP